MAPKRQQPPHPPQRRSSRIASKAGSSRAPSSIETGEDADAVIYGFRDKTDTLERRVEELEERNESLAKERDEAVRRQKERPSLRDSFFRDALQNTAREIAQEKEARERAAKQQRADQGGLRTQPASPRDKWQPSVPSQEDDAAHRTQLAVQDTHAMEVQRESLPAYSLLKPGQVLINRIIHTLSSPFTGRRPASPTQSPALPPAQGPPAQPLGELTADRKRRATEPAPEEPATVTTSTPRVGSKTPRTLFVPPTRNPNESSALTTITEQSEHTEASLVVPQATPSRQPRSITKMRREAREREERERLTRTVNRAWTPKPTPREPNADARLQKLRHFNDLTSQMNALKEDAEIQEMVRRQVKRVKIDDLLFVPHNRPGDPSGRFCMYDVDDDDEMEVWADTEMKPNVFQGTEDKPMATATTTPSKDVTKLATTEEPEPALTQQREPEPVLMPQHEPEPALIPLRKPEVFDFPSVGQDGPVAQDNPLAAAKFAYGFLHFEQTGQVISGLY